MAKLPFDNWIWYHQHQGAKSALISLLNRLAKLFGCVRVVWNDSLAYCQQKYISREKKPNNSQLQKQFITQSKKTEDREWLSEVSAIPLQQSLNYLNQALL